MIVLSGLVKVTVLMGQRVTTGAGGVYWCCWETGGLCGGGAWCGEDVPSSDGIVVNFTRMLVLGNRNVQLKLVLVMID